MREALILAILSEGKKYGREVRDECETRARHKVPLGSLYTTLSRMDEKGLIRSQAEESSAGRGGNRRNYYQITGVGQMALSDYVGKSGYLFNLVPNYD